MSRIWRIAQGLGLENISLVQGVFDSSIPDFNRANPSLEVIGGIIDSDLYLGYTSPLEFFKMRLMKGGFVYLDGYFSLKFPGARIAVDEFLEKNADFQLESWKDPLDPTWRRFGLLRTDEAKQRHVRATSQDR